MRWTLLILTLAGVAALFAFLIKVEGGEPLDRQDTGPADDGGFSHGHGGDGH